MTRKNLCQKAALIAMSLFVIVATATTTRAQMHDQQTGSTLIYNYYNSDSNTPWGQNTIFTITNTNTLTYTQVNLFYVNGDTGAVKRNSICLRAGATWSALMSDENPNVTGYIVAVAVTGNGTLRNFNWLMGTAAITISSGHRATLPAIARSYGAQAPNQLMVDMVPSPQDGQFPLLVVNRINGNLTSQMASLGNVSGVVSHTAIPVGRVAGDFPFTINSTGPQVRRVLDNSLPLSGTTLSGLIYSGETAFMTLNSGANQIVGSVLYFSPNTGISTGAFTGGNNLRQTSYTNSLLVIPTVKPLFCPIF